MNSLFPDLFDEGKTPEAPAAAQPTPEYDLTDLFERLSHSPFRSRFRLKPADIAYIREKGMDTIRSHASDFVRTRLAPAQIPNDGSGCQPERRKTDAHAGASGLHRPACHGLLLPRMLRQVAPYSGGPSPHTRRAALCRGRTDEMDRKIYLKKTIPS